MKSAGASQVHTTPEQSIVARGCDSRRENGGARIRRSSPQLDFLLGGVVEEIDELLVVNLEDRLTEARELPNMVPGRGEGAA